MEQMLVLRIKPYADQAASLLPIICLRRRRFLESVAPTFGRRAADVPERTALTDIECGSTKT